MWFFRPVVCGKDSRGAVIKKPWGEGAEVHVRREERSGLGGEGCGCGFGLGEGGRVVFVGDYAVQLGERQSLTAAMGGCGQGKAEFGHGWGCEVVVWAGDVGIRCFCRSTVGAIEVGGLFGFRLGEGKGEVARRWEGCGRWDGLGDWRELFRCLDR